jgi:hypothetical protein
MFKFLLATCPINGQELIASDWWHVISRHKDYDCAEDELSKVSKAKLENHSYRIFNLQGYLPGEEFNIKTVLEHKAKNKNIEE